MNKPDLIEHLIERHDLTRAFARELVDDVLGHIVAAAQQGEAVSLYGFGKFKVAERAARKGRNPRTSEAVKIAASKNLKFTPARSLKTSLNTKRRAKKGSDPTRKNARHTGRKGRRPRFTYATVCRPRTGTASWQSLCSR